MGICTDLCGDWWEENCSWMHDHHKLLTGFTLRSTVRVHKVTNDQFLLMKFYEYQSTSPICTMWAQMFLLASLIWPGYYSPVVCRPHQPLTVVRLVVSTDGEQYRVVDVSGAPDGTWIRRHILLKVRILPAQSWNSYEYLVTTSYLFLSGCMHDSPFIHQK